MSEPIWLDERDALILHERLLVLHGGAAGVRDTSLLESAVARPRQHFTYAQSPSIFQFASLYTAGIVRNHPFVDGNTRTGFVLGILFLEMNGFAFTASEEDTAQAVIALAAGTIDETSYAAFLADNSRAR